jgi:effector-binding domain-containing protein/carbon monoxide dehydrogenase subunit G
MRFLKRLVLFLFVLIVVLIGVAFFLPNSGHVERSITIARPPSMVFAVLNSYRRFNDWSPWVGKDPNAHYTVTGPVAGVGAKESWVGDPKTVGSGSQEIIESKADESVTMALDFGDMGKAKARFLLSPEDKGTRVKWTLDTQAPLALDGKVLWNTIGRYMGLFMDSMVGPDYETGLAKLKTLVETFPDVDIRGVGGEALVLAPRKIYFVSASSGPDSESAKAVLTEAYGKLGKYLADNSLTMQGAPLTITTSYDKSGWKFDAAIPVDRNNAATRDDIQAGATYAGNAVQFMHVGPYDKIGDTITGAYAWLSVQGYKAKGRLIEDYISDPGKTPAEQLQTKLTIPVE